MRAALFALGAAVGLSVAGVSSAYAQEGKFLELRPGFTSLLQFDRPIRTVVIGNPAVADALAQTDRAILVTGRAVGSTNLIVLDTEGQEVYSSLVLVSIGRADPGDVRIHSVRGLHTHYSYYCTPHCVMVGEVRPPRVRPPAHERTVSLPPRDEREEREEGQGAPPSDAPAREAPAPQ